MIKYINIYPADQRISDRHPTHKLAITHENGDKQYIGAVWIKENGMGSIQLADGVTFSIAETVKIYPQKKLTKSPDPGKYTTTPEEVAKTITVGLPIHNELPPVEPNDIPF